MESANSFDISTIKRVTFKYFMMSSFSNELFKKIFRAKFDDLLICPYNITTSTTFGQTSSI